MRSRGRRNRGRGHNADNKDTPRLGLQDYVYDVGETSNPREFEKVTDYLMTYIRKTFTHGARCARSLEDRQVVSDPMPRLQKSTSTDVDIANHENEEFKTLHSSVMKLYVDEQVKFKHQMDKMYGLLPSQCSDQLQHKIKTTKDFDTRIKNDPIELLKTRQFRPATPPPTVGGLCNALVCIVLCRAT
jgi:hypothetical protein